MRPLSAWSMLHLLMAALLLVGMAARMAPAQPAPDAGMWAFSGPHFLDPYRITVGRIGTCLDPNGVS